MLTFDPTPAQRKPRQPNAFDDGRSDGTTTNSYFGGLIDEPAIYNRALTPAEILAIRQAGAAGKCKVKPSILVQPVSQRVNSGSNVTVKRDGVGIANIALPMVASRGQSILGATNSSYSSSRMRPLPPKTTSLLRPQSTNSDHQESSLRGCHRQPCHRPRITDVHIR